MAAEAVVLISICEFPYKHLDLFAEGFGDCSVCGVVYMVGGCEEVEGREMLFLIVTGE